MSSPEPKPHQAKLKFIMICVNRRFRADEASCALRGSQELADALEAGINERRIDIQLERSVCMSHCQKGPTIRLAPGGRFILGKTLDDVNALLDEIESLCGTRPERARELPVNLLGS